MIEFITYALFIALGVIIGRAWAESRFEIAPEEETFGDEANPINIRIINADEISKWIVTDIYKTTGNPRNLIIRGIKDEEAEL